MWRKRSDTAFSTESRSGEGPNRPAWRLIINKRKDELARDGGRIGNERAFRAQTALKSALTSIRPQLNFTPLVRKDGSNRQPPEETFMRDLRRSIPLILALL